MKTVKFILELFYVGGGGKIEREIEYFGEDLEEIGRAVDNDHNALLDYMISHDDHGSKSFCFGGFMFQKEGLLAANLKELDIQI